MGCVASARDATETLGQGFRNEKQSFTLWSLSLSGQTAEPGLAYKEPVLTPYQADQAGKGRYESEGAKDLAPAKWAGLRCRIAPC